MIYHIVGIIDKAFNLTRQNLCDSSIFKLVIRGVR